MNWDAIGAVGEIIGALAVIASLLYLAIQIRQSNMYARMEARQRMIEHVSKELNAQMLDPDITYANVKEEALTETEQAKLSFFWINFMRQRELEWYLYKDSAIDEDIYRSYHEVIPIHIGTERGKRWWSAVGRYAFNTDFVADVDLMLERSEPSTYLLDIRHWDRKAEMV